MALEAETGIVVSVKDDYGYVVLRLGARSE